MKANDIVFAVFNPAGYFIEQLRRNSAEFERKVDTFQLAELEVEALREEIKSKAIQNAAKAEQEIAIARRILAAEEVEIEEYYDGEASGNVGLGVGKSSLSIGVSGAGKKVTKRVIRFKGFGGELLAVDSQTKD